MRVAQSCEHCLSDAGYGTSGRNKHEKHSNDIELWKHVPGMLARDPLAESALARTTLAENQDVPGESCREKEIQVGFDRILRHDKWRKGQILTVEPCQRGMDIGARTYGSVQSILRNGLDRAFRSEPVPDELPVQHENIRGSGYYH